MPPPKVIYVYPTPSNLDKIQYKDRADNCYSFDMTEVKCPANNDYKRIPVQ